MRIAELIVAICLQAEPSACLITRDHDPLSAAGAAQG